MKQKGIVYTSASAMLFGITPLITTHIYAYGANSLTVVFYRSLFVTIMLALLCKIMHIRFAVTKRQFLDIAIVTCCGSGLTTVLLFAAYEYIDTGTATSLHFLYPVFVALLCRLFYHERLGKQKRRSFLLALIGMLCFLCEVKGGSSIGYAMAIASSLSYAFYMVYLEKRRLTQINSFLLSFYIGIFMTAQTLLFHMIQPQIHFSLPSAAYLYLLLLALCSSFLAVVWLQKGIRCLGSTTASLFCLFEPITSLSVGVLFMGESLTVLKLTATILIITALLHMSIADSHQGNKTKEIPANTKAH